MCHTNFYISLRIGVLSMVLTQQRMKCPSSSPPPFMAKLLIIIAELVFSVYCEATWNEA